MNSKTYVLSSIQSPMSSPRLQYVSEQDLDDTEREVAEALRDWLAANPDADWKVSRGFKDVEQCSERGIAALRDITRPLSTRVRCLAI